MELSNNRRGFYVQMKLLKHKNKDKNTCFKYYKYYIIWLSLSIYFFTSYFITNTKQPHLHATYLSSPRTISRSLFESQPTHAINHHLKNLKIFVYNLPTEYNEDWLTNKRCATHLFASEVAIHKALLTSDVRTFDPYEADFFFVPVYVSCNFSTVNGFPDVGHAKKILWSAVKLVSSEYPFWNRSHGSDHVFVASHDYGACFHAMEDKAVEDGIPEFLKNSIILQTFGVTYKHPCQDVDNVVIPPYISPESVQKTLEEAEGRRDIWVYFRGKMEVHPKNISGRFYSKRVRTEIWHRFNRDGRFYLKRHRFSGYRSELARSVFCLCPLGWAPWSPRLVESIALGCVPVIIADNIRLPFTSIVPWPNISLSIAERDVRNIGKILEHVAASNLSRIQDNLRQMYVSRALLFNSRVQEGDATWQILDSLVGKLHKSHRRTSQLYSDT